MKFVVVEEVVRVDNTACRSDKRS